MINISVFLILLLGGIGIYVNETIYLVIILSLMLLFSVYIKNGKILLPKHIGLSALFLFSLAISMIWSVNLSNSFNVFCLFLSGILLWIYSSNESSLKMVRLIVILTTLYTLLAYVQNNWGIIRNTHLGLIAPMNSKHHHLGDLWSITLLIPIFAMGRGISIKNKIILLSAIAIGLLTIYISGSRTAVVSLLVPVFIYFLSRFKNRSKIISTLVILLITAILFVAISRQRTILLDRPYILQSIVSFPKHIFGIGMGNFGYISQTFEKSIPLFGGFSEMTHSIPFELLSGMGIMSIFAFLFFVKMCSKELLGVQKKPQLKQLLIIGLLTSFMFDITYNIPLFLWLFFLLLGSGNAYRDDAIKIGIK